ncbi:MAG TPA: flagellar protein FlaG [Candidatus Hydrogenedentes bacterium]|nr:flagellar protein FlaG [Candidatus Hydrogenedentota bacterium]
MGVPSVLAPELRYGAAPAAVRTPSSGAPDHAPTETRSVEKQQESTESPRKSEPVQLQNSTSIRLRIDKETNRIIAQVVNENNEVVRQIPPDEALKIAANTRQLLGLLFDETV